MEDCTMEADDDMILVIVGDVDFVGQHLQPEDAPDIRSQEATCKEEVISNKSISLESDNNGLVQVKENPVHTLDVTKKELDFSQLEQPNDDFLNFLKCTENDAEKIQPVRRRGRPRKYPEKINSKPLQKSAISDNVIVPRSLYRSSRSSRRLKPNPKYNAYMSCVGVTHEKKKKNEKKKKTGMAKKPTKEDKLELLESLLKFDDFDSPSPWLKYIRQKINLDSSEIKTERKRRKKYKNSKDSASSDNNITPSLELRKAKRNSNPKLKCKVLKSKSAKKYKKLKDLNVSSDDNMALSLEVQKAKTNSNPKRKCKVLKRKFTKRYKSLKDSAVSSDDSITPLLEVQKAKRNSNPKQKFKELKRKSTKKEPYVNEDVKSIEESSDSLGDSPPTLEQSVKKEKKTFEDTAVNSDENITPSEKFPNTRKRANANTKSNMTELKIKRIKKEENELFEDTPISSDDDYKDHLQFENPRRFSFTRNPKSFVAELIKQHPRLANNTEALVGMLVDAMRMVKPPPQPKNFYVMKDLMYRCTTCGHGKRTIPAITQHYNEKHGPRYMNCFACGVDFRSNTNLYKHEIRCVAPDAAVVLRARARYLGAKGRSRPFLDPALKEPSKPLKPEFLCSLCPATFMTHAWLTAHLNTHLGIRPYICETCGLSYTNATTLSKHRKQHSSQEFICDHCKRSFKMKSFLVTHLDTHLPQPRFLCEECPQRYSHRVSLERHVHRVHRQLPPPAACALCPRRYPKIWSLKKHMLREHGVHIMTRKAFLNKLPSLTEKQLKEAQVATVLNGEDYIVSDEKEESENIEVNDRKNQSEDNRDDTLTLESGGRLQENGVSKEHGVEILNDSSNTNRPGKVSKKTKKDKSITLCKATQDSGDCSDATENQKEVQKL